MLATPGGVGWAWFSQGIRLRAIGLAPINAFTRGPVRACVDGTEHEARASRDLGLKKALPPRRHL
jgi:hypothetical protein